MNDQPPGDLATDSAVVRVIRRIGLFFPPDATKPAPRAFALTDEDLEDAQQRGVGPMLSVFDRDRTTADQARAFRTSPGPFAVYGLVVGSVEGIRVAERAAPALRVVRDPLVDDRPGADGHCGITGLDQRAGEEKRVIKSLQSQLADICFLVDP